MPPIKTWIKDTYHISTDPSLIPIPTLNTWFASPDFYWAKPLPEDIMAQTLQNSLCFGLFSTPSTSTENASSTDQSSKKGTVTKKEFIGLARLITDYTTFAYLTDVFILPSHQGHGLGKWLMACVMEVTDEMKYIRRSMLFTGDWERSVPFYERELGMRVMESSVGEKRGLAVMERKGRGSPWFVGQ
jgi:ribosomal protein S18 acetylase RimI-like enzyme